MRFPFRPWGSRSVATTGRAIVAKPKRRQFTAEYRLRILEEADRCTQPGEVGRLLRREGLYSSHLTAWRKARRKGSLRELAAKKRGAKPGERNPLDAKVRALEAQVARLEHELHTAHTILDVQGKVAGLGIEPRTERAFQPLAAHGVAPACQHWACHGRPSTGRGQLPGTSSPVQRPPGRCVKPSASRSSMARRPALRRPCAGGGRGDAARRRPLPVLGADDVSDPDQPVRERRNQREHPQYTKPELVARRRTRPGPGTSPSCWGRWTYFYLYVVLDIFSRYARLDGRRPGELGAGRSSHRRDLHKQGVQPQVLTLHSDRGAPMTSKCTAQLLADLGVTRSLSRPQVSDEFKTLKYHPGFPGRFHDITAAIAFCRTFFPWYNTEHRHGGIAMLTPDDVHHNRTQSVLEQRGRTLQAAWTRHPERFVRGIPQPHPLPQAVWINLPVTPTTGETAQ